MMRGAAQVVDHMALPADDLQALKEGILSATSHLDEQQIEALLQDNVSMFVSCTLTRPLPTWKPSSRRQSRRLRRTSGAARWRTSLGAWLLLLLVQNIAGRGAL
jgi:hypothetical protein